jgi:hypothetical protein
MVGKRERPMQELHIFTFREQQILLSGLKGMASNNFMRRDKSGYWRYSFNFGLQSWPKQNKCPMVSTDAGEGNLANLLNLMFTPQQ